MATSTLFDLMDAVESGLETYFDSNSLAAVQVFTMYVGDVPGEFIHFRNWEVDQEYFSMGGSRLETYNVEGMLRVTRPENSEAGGETCRNRAKTIFAAVENYLRANPIPGSTSGVKDCVLTSFNVAQGRFENGTRVVDVTFTLTIRAVV